MALAAIAAPAILAPLLLKHSKQDLVTRKSLTSARCLVSLPDGAPVKNVETTMGRREALLGASFASALVLGPMPLVLPESAQAADIVQRQQRAAFLTKLKNALAVAVEANQELIPGLLRLAVNDALTYDKATKTGGANGSIRFSEELERPENKGLGAALELLEKVKGEVDQDAKGGPVSYADLIQFGAAAGVKRTFINSCIGKTGGDPARGLDLYRAIGSAGQWGQFDKLFGRADADAADPAGRIPANWAETSTLELTQLFEPFGLKPRQITILSIFLADDAAAFEAKLAEDAEYLPWVEKYLKSRSTISETDYQVDLITAFSKLSTLGAPINTEAYTFARPRLNLRF